MTLSIRDVQDTWAMLESVADLSRGLRVREIESLNSIGGAVLFGIEPNGIRHVLVPIQSGAIIAEDRRSAGVQIRRHSFVDEGVDRTFVDIVCNKPHLHEVFSLIAADMLRHLTSDDPQPDRQCGKVLNRWRELLDRGGRTTPGIETVTGLFGELFVLRQAVRLSPAALSTWVGPSGARHDFSAAHVSLEVKTTLSRRGRFVEINGHQQLEPVADRPLFLIVLRLEEVKGSGESLSDLIADLVADGADSADLTRLVDEAGVSPEHLEAASSRRFVVVDQVSYRVADPFPRITSNDFVSGSLPDGVISLRYVIDLSGPMPPPLGTAEATAVFASLAAGATG